MHWVRYRAITAAPAAPCPRAGARSTARQPDAQRTTPPLAPLPPAPHPRPRSYLLVEQVPGHSQLRLADEGLALLRSIAKPIAPVVVIGPYRSGKSFLLNQLLGVGCGARADAVWDGVAA